MFNHREAKHCCHWTAAKLVIFNCFIIYRALQLSKDVCLLKKMLSFSAKPFLLHVCNQLKSARTLPTCKLFVGLHQQNTTGAGPGSQLPVLWIIPQGSPVTTAGKETLDSADNSVLEVEHVQNKQLKVV